MKIAFLSTMFPFRGGIAQFNALLYRALEEKNEVKAFTFKRQYPNFLFPGETQYVTKDDKVDEIDSLETLDTINPFTYLATAKKINRFEPDIIITKYWMTFFAPSLGGVLKRMKKNTKRISVLDNVIPHEKRFFDARANKFFLKYNDGFIVMSDAVLADLLSLKPDAKYMRVNHPVYNQFGDTLPREEALKKLKLDPSNKYMLFFGFIRDYKGLDLLIEAMNHLPEDHHLIVAGEVYGSFEKYTKMIDDSKLNDRVHLFNHYISDDEVTLYFSASDACVLPYKSATQSGITAISHHFNLPVIATDVGGLKETIEHGETGLIVSEPKSQLISDAILSYYANNFQKKFSAKIASEKAENSWSNFADKLVAFSKTL
jgi:glycosyltransferase involved in cell wall biosynthesis